MLQDKLSKSRFTKGLRCPRWLYLDVHHHELADAISPETQARFDIGNRIGVLAQQRYPHGVLMEENYLHHRDAVEHTRQVLAEGAEAVFEAAFTFDDVKVRADILTRLSDGRYAMYEVKSTGAYDKAKHLDDVAVQLYVLRGAGLDVADVALMHLNKDYVYAGGGYDVNDLFAVTPLLDAAEEVLPQIPDFIGEMMKTLASAEMPERQGDVDCKGPYPCAFLGYCHADDPAHPITELPSSGRNTRLRKEMDARGIADLMALPDDIVARLNRVQKLTWEATTQDRCIIEQQARCGFAELVFPVHFLDFETINPGLPLFVGTRPFQIIPVQWSDHILHDDGTLEHKEFLATANTDPSREFATTLLDALGEIGTVVHYSPYEWTQMKSLAARFGDVATPLLAVEHRLFDLARPIKDHCFDPRFHGGYSIKYALPVLAPGLPRYKELAVQNGDMAMRVYAEMLDPETLDERRVEIEHDLRVYCRQDTLGMVEIYRTLSHS
jgi:hypothetical protein